ncbi:MAG: MOP flippase family protein [Desulfatiglans sp.]|nr:MOP flippase family protein [Desulfatiglans sp.]
MSFFAPQHPNTDLKKQSLRGGAVTLTSQSLSLVIHLGSTMILARILSPQDYGIIAMVAAITGFAGVFSDLGLSTATIQRDKISHEQVSNLFWINAGLGLIITLVVASLSPAVAWFYHTPQLVWVTVVLSMNFMITGLGVQHQALLTRQMRFFSLAKIHIFSMLLGIGIAILMALHGYRYWALVFNTITLSASNTFCLWLVARWQPCLPKHKTGIRPMIRFGSDIAGFNTINFFARNLDNILIGRYHGSGPLGFYSKAYQLLMMPITNFRAPLDKVALPAMSRLQNDHERFRDYYMEYLSILSFIYMPLVTFMFVCSDNIIKIILGPQWIKAGEIFRILAIAALIQPVGSSRGLVLLSTGQSRKYLFQGVTVALIISLAIVLGVSKGAKGVAWAYAISVYAVLFPSLFFSYKNTSIHIGHFLEAIKQPFAASLAMGVICYLLLSKIRIFGDMASLVICLITGILSYLGLIIFFSRGLKNLLKYYEYSKLMFKNIH